MGVVIGAMRTREIAQDLAVDFGWRRVAFPQIALHVGEPALITLTAAARLMCVKETYGIDNVYN